MSNKAADIPGGNEENIFISKLSASFPRNKFELLQVGEQIIILHDLSFDLGRPDTFQPNIFLIFNDNVMENLNVSGKTDTRNCWEITAPSGETVFLLPAAQRNEVAEHGIFIKNERIKKLAKKNIAEKKLTENNFEIHSAKALTGNPEYGPLVPVLAGLKPVCVLDEELEPGHPNEGVIFFKELAKTVSPPLIVDRFINGDGKICYVFYNPSAVQEIIQANPEIFAPMSIDSQTPLLKVIKDIIIKPFSSRESLDDIAASNAMGILLGYDKNSVLNYKPSVRHDSHTALGFWNTNYVVDDPEHNRTFQELQSRYSALVRHIEELLKNGATPMEVLKALPGWQRIADVIEEVHTRIGPHPLDDGIRP